MQPQDLTNLLTAALGVATVWLAVETRRMAVAARASIELESRPYLSIRGLYLKLGSLKDLSAANSGAARLGIRLYNPGKVLVTYSVKSISATVANCSAANQKFDTTGGVIHPGEETIFFYPILQSPQAIQAPCDGEMSFEIEYNSTKTQRQVVSGKLRLIITSHNPVDYEWLFTEGPNYA